MPFGLVMTSLLPVLARGTRSTVLNTLAWMMLLLIAGMLGSYSVKSDPWLPIFFAALAAIDFIAFIGAFIYFAFSNPDALRSEHFSIQKMAIQHGLLGDSKTGMFDAGGEELKRSDQLLTEASKQIENKQ